MYLKNANRGIFQRVRRIRAYTYAQKHQGIRASEHPEHPRAPKSTQSTQEHPKHPKHPRAPKSTQEHPKHPRAPRLCTTLVVYYPPGTRFFGCRVAFSKNFIFFLNKNFIQIIFYFFSTFMPRKFF